MAGTIAVRPCAVKGNTHRFRQECATSARSGQANQPQHHVQASPHDRCCIILATYIPSYRRSVDQLFETPRANLQLEDGHAVRLWRDHGAPYEEDEKIASAATYWSGTRTPNQRMAEAGESVPELTHIPLSDAERTAICPNCTVI